MPIESAFERRIGQQRILRFAAGTSLSLWVSQVFAWPLSYLAPVLCLTLLGLPVSRPKAKFFITIFIVMVASVYGSFILLPLLAHQRLVGLLLLSLVLFHTFYFTARGGPAVLGTFLTIGLTLTVAVGSTSIDALIGAAAGVTAGALVGIGTAWLCHVLLPDPIDLNCATSATEPDRPGGALARHNALRSLVIVLPITIWFLLSPSSAANIAIMVKVAAMGQESSTSGARNAARSLLMSTLVGGAAAVIGWQCLAVWPSLTLYTLLIALASLLFGTRIFKGSGLHVDSAIWSYALLTMIVVLAPAVLDSQFGGAAGARFYDRLLMLLGASLYGVGAAYLFDAMWPAPERRDPLQDTALAP